MCIRDSFASLPSIAPYRTIASGDIVVAEAILTYGEDDRYDTQDRARDRLLVEAVPGC